jgi:NAD+ synthase
MPQDRPEKLTIALAQINPLVGDVRGNLALLRAARAQAAKGGAANAGADLVVASELCLVGYPPEDLVLRPSLQAEARAAVETLALETGDGGPGLIVGAPWVADGKLYNAAALLAEGKIAALVFKHDLPNYGVFDEKRVFAAGPMPGPVVLRGVRLGLMVCEDMWQPDVAECLAETGAEMLVIINGSPFEADKSTVRLDLARKRVAETQLPLIYVNQVGGQDELVFDGNSFVLDATGDVAQQLAAFATDLGICRMQSTDAGWQPKPQPLPPAPHKLDVIWRALVLGLRDYVEKNRFPGVVLGLSGGVDSAVSAAVAVDALGASRVRCLMLPSRFTSRSSRDDALDCARRLGIQLDEISIEPAVAAYQGMLAGLFAGTKPDATEENIQARVRGMVLMAFSNKFGHMLITTGNKSEMSVGYSTLYGDMAGGYSVVKDVYKTTVYQLARWRNGHRPEGALGPEGEVICESILSKAPTAELRANQTDQDTLPPYDQLDAILEGLVERELSVDAIAAQGLPRDVVARVQNMLYGAEYKRRQSPPGVKITSKNFGRDRRYPMVNAFRDRT